MTSGVETSGGKPRLNRNAVPEWIKATEFHKDEFENRAADVLAGGKRRLSAVASFAVAHLPRELTLEERAELTVSEARDAQRARNRNYSEIEEAFEVLDPTPEQLRLRERAWDASPYQPVFPTLEVRTMRFAGEHSNGLPSKEDRERHRRLQDDRDFWTADRDCAFTLRELRSRTRAYKPVRSAIIDGATRYAYAWLMPKQTSAFERWFTRSKDFRVFTIPYLAVAHMDGAEDLHVREREANQWAVESPSRNEIKAIRAAMACFRFEQSTAKELAEAKRIWDENAAHMPLPAVDLFTGELATRRNCHAAEVSDE